MMLTIQRITIAFIAVFHVTNAMHHDHNSLYDYATFKHVKEIAHDVKSIIQKYDKFHAFSQYGLNPHAHQTESGLFLSSVQYGVCVSYSLYTPWGAVSLARIEGTFVRSQETNSLVVKFSTQQSACIDEIMNYFADNFEVAERVDIPLKFKETIDLFPIIAFKTIQLAPAQENKQKKLIAKELIEAAWKALLTQKYSGELGLQ